jgi:hypothetical protein
LCRKFIIRIYNTKAKTKPKAGDGGGGRNEPEGAFSHARDTKTVQNFAWMELSCEPRVEWSSDPPSEHKQEQAKLVGNEEN